MQLDALPAGARLGEHTVVSRLGQGGMGVVYEARDARLGRSVAIKVPSLGLLQDATARARFEREARASAVVSHPSVVTVFGVADVGGWPCLVLELLTGGSLRERLRTGGALPWREACTLTRDVARGLEAIHAAGLVHRDLKPENVLFDAHGRPKITDLGLVRGGQDAGDLTRTGQLLGTRAYMAPEQIDQARGVGPSADLYSLGCMLHELIAGAPPFPGSGYDVISKHLSAAPPRLKDVPAPVAALALSLLAKTPEERPGSAGAVVEALDALLAPAPPAGVTSRWPALAGAVGAVVVVAAAVGGAALVVQRRASAPADGASVVDAATTTPTPTGVTETTQAPPAAATTRLRLSLQTTTRLPAPAWDLAVLSPARLVWSDNAGRVWLLGERDPLAAHADDAFVTTAGPDHLVTACRVYSKDGRVTEPEVKLWRPGARGLPEGREHGIEARAEQDERGAIKEGVIKALVAFEDGGVVVSTVDGQVHVLERGRPPRRLRGAQHQPMLAVCEGPRRVLAADRAGRLLVWDLARADDAPVLDLVVRELPPSEINHPIKGLRQVAVTPDGRVAVTGDDLGVVAFTTLDAESPAPQLGDRGHAAPLSAIAVAPDGRLVVCGDAGGGLVVWDVATRARVCEDLGTHRTNVGKPSRVHEVVFLGPTRFATLSSDDVLREWEVEALPSSR